jgi:hypothetical protein
MRKQDIGAIIVLVIVFSFLGIWAVGALTSPPSETYQMSEEPDPIPAGFNDKGIEYMQSGFLRDFTVRVDGVEVDKNARPFSD